jgi:hypothetical protein
MGSSYGTLTTMSKKQPLEYQITVDSPIPDDLGLVFSIGFIG